MTGPEHYRQAEAIMAELAIQTEALRRRGKIPVAEAQQTLGEFQASLQAAQVHATLALAAASAQNIRRNGALDGGIDGWAEALRGAE